MKITKAIVLLSLLAATLFQGWMAVDYERSAKKLRDQAVSLNAQVEKVKAQYKASGERLKAQHEAVPVPFAEIMQQEMQNKGFTNLNCVVWGEKNGKMIGFMIDSNSIVPMPNFSVRVIAEDADDAKVRRRL